MVNGDEDKAKEILSALAIDSEYDKLSLRVAHLQCLYDFVQEELLELIELRVKIAAGTLKAISFENLWHLFEPGDLIVSRDHGHDQLYKAYSVTGGQIRKRPRTSDELREIEQIRRDKSRFIPVDIYEVDYDDVEKEIREEGSSVGTWTPFQVDCYLMAYDGSDIGPVEDCKKVKHYFGERLVSELPLYPVRFHPEKDNFLRKMEDRGRKFLSCAGYKRYEGMTLTTRRDESYEEIESDIYIDFEEYYQRNPTKKPNIGKLLRSRQDRSEVDELVANAEYRYISNHEVDQKLADDFMSANRTFLEKNELKEFDHSPDHLRLMPHQVVGYALRQRQWCKYIPLAIRLTS